MKPFKIGLTTVTFRQKTPEEICRIAQKYALDGIEWGTDVHVPTPDAAKAVRALCDQYKIKTFSLGAYHRIGGSNPVSFSDTLQSASILGAKRIRVWLGTKSSCLFTEAEKQQLLHETQELLRLAKPYHIGIAFEFHRKTWNDNGISSLAFLKEIHDASLSTYWQPFFHETPEEDFPFTVDKQNLLTVAPYISAAHVFSWDEKANRFPFDYHKEAWKTFLSLLSDTPCEELIMEFVLGDSEEQFAEDLIVLHNLIQE